MWLRSFASVDPPPMVLTINPCRPCWTLVIFFKISGVVSHTIYFWNEVGDSNFVCFISDTVTHYLSAVKLKKQSIDWKIFARTPQASEVSGILKKNSAQKMRLRRPPFQIWTGSQAVHVYMTLFRPTRNWRERQKPTVDLTSFTKSEKSTFHYLQCFHFWVRSKFGSRAAKLYPRVEL